MSNNLCNEPGKKSVRINGDEVDDFEELGLADTSASTVFSELLERALLLKKIQDEKIKEHREIRQEIRHEENLYGLD